MLTPFFRELREEKKMCSYFMQHNATGHRANFSMTALEEVFHTADNLRAMVS
jgi:hypothetical protein